MSKRVNRRGKYAEPVRRKTMPIALLILTDILLVGMILVVFAFFHHVLPAMISEYERQQSLQNPTVTEAPDMPTRQPASTEPDAPQTQPMETVPQESAAETQPHTEPDAEPDNRTEWQIKFADKFSDETEITDNSYRSPNVSITLETITVGEGDDQITYHVADIYLASMENFVTHTANGEMRYFGTQDVLEMDRDAGAVLSLSGDFLTYQRNGFLMRNQQVYVRDNNLDSICVLYSDGTLQTYEPKTYDIDEIIAAGALQVWSFGPPLLDENGKAMDSYKVSSAVSYPNPRSAIGYYEPGHYLFVLVDGRQKGYSKGMKIDELARVFEDYGCACAYNLDGGGSAVMVFNGERYSKQSNGGDRKLGDILVIRDVAPTEEAGG